MLKLMAHNCFGCNIKINKPDLLQEGVLCVKLLE